jgi:hypothetical protein
VRFFGVGGGGMADPAPPLPFRYDAPFISGNERRDNPASAAMPRRITDPERLLSLSGCDDRAVGVADTEAVRRSAVVQKLEEHELLEW